MKYRRSVFLILSVSFLLKVVLWIFILMTNTRHFLAADSAGYERIAMAVLKTGTYASSAEKPQIPETNRTPGYPTFLALIYKAARPNPSIAIFAQILLSTASIAIVYWIAYALWGEKTAFFAILLSALDIGLLSYSLILLTETLFTFLLLCMLAMLIPSLKIPQRSKFPLLTGLFLGLATMVRPISYYLFVPLFLGFIFVALRSCSERRTLYAPLWFLLPFLIIVGGWQTRNYFLTGYFTFSRIQGDLLLKKSAEVVAARDKVTFEQAMKRITDEQKKGSPGAQSPERIDHFWMKQGPLYLLKYPSYYVKRETRRAVRLFAPSGHRIFIFFGFNLRNWPLGDLKTLSVKKYIDRWLVRHPVWFIFTAFMVIHLLFLYAGGVYALWHGWKNRPVRAVHLCYGMVFLYFLLVSLAIGFQSRFVLPVMPLLHLYTARAIILLKDRKFATCISAVTV